MRGGRPRLIVPSGRRGVLRAALGRGSADVSRLARLQRSALSGAAALGAAELLVARDGFNAGLAPAGEDPPLEDYLAGALGCAHVEVVTSVGPKRPNQKPVLQVMRRDGTTLGFAKVGWNGLTRRLVNHEAAVLRELATTSRHLIGIPEVLHLGTWRRLDISILSPLEPQRDNPMQRRDPTGDELAELASLGATDHALFRESAYRAQLAERVTAVASSRRAPYESAMQALDDAWGATAFTFGRLHGDWTPWNMAPLADRLLVWDWERSRSSAPVLIDSVHYEFQRAWLRRKQSPGDAIETAVRFAAGYAPDLGVEATTVRAIAGMYLLELSLRYAENAAEGTSELRPERHSAIETALTDFDLSA
jgi:hypothetical protein